MATQNINSVTLTGNLTRDPELRATGSGLNICSMRLAVNGRRKDGQSGQWVDEPNYFDITCFGGQAENCSRFLSKGRPIAVQGRLKWREWTSNEGQKRQAVEVIADTVQFLNSGDGSHGGGGGGSDFQRAAPDAEDFQPPPTGASGGGSGFSRQAPDDDIPF